MAKAGSVPAMRLCWELLGSRRASNTSSEEAVLLELDALALSRMTNGRTN